MGYEVFLLRKEHPGKFGPGPLELAQSFYEESMGKGKKNENDADENNGANENDDQIGNDDDEAPRGESSADENKLLVSGATIPPDPTREPRRRSVVNVERSSMRMWAM